MTTKLADKTVPANSFSANSAGSPSSLADGSFPKFKVLGIAVSAVQIPDVVRRMEYWIKERNGSHYIAVTGMHGVTAAQHDPEVKMVLNSADMVVADGMPLVWLGRLRGFPLRRRVYGPELMLAFCSQTAARGYRHYFYGGDTGVADRLASIMRERFPGLKIAGTCSPPFRSLTEKEDEEYVSRINNSRADVVWVSLGGVAQDRWMFEHRERLNAPAVAGVGAAFDFHAGLKKQAPVWMREHGFEWLFRLLQEPRRLWRRYLVYGSQFVYLVLLEQLRLRKSD